MQWHRFSYRMIALCFLFVSFSQLFCCECIFFLARHSSSFGCSLFLSSFRKLSASPMKTLEIRYLIRYTKSNYIFNMTNVKIRLDFFPIALLLLLLLSYSYCCVLLYWCRPLLLLFVLVDYCIFAWRCIENFGIVKHEYTTWLSILSLIQFRLYSLNH